MRPVAFGEALPAGTRLTLFSDDKPDRFFTVIKFWMDKTSGVALNLKTGVSTYPSRRRLAAPKACRRREEGRIHLLIQPRLDAPKIAEAPQKRSEPVLDALQTSRSNGLANAKETDMTFE
jgi:hypothetical protein